MRHVMTTKSDLAQAYFPHLQSRSALNKFNQIIKSDKHLWQMLQELSYTPRTMYVTPAQQDAIFSRLGSPF